MNYRACQQTARLLADAENRPDLYHALLYFLTWGDGVRMAWKRALRLAGG